MRSLESCWMRRVYSWILGSLASSSALGTGGGVAATQMLSGGRTFVGVGEGVGVGAGPPKKEKSVVIEEDSHGTCSPRVAATTPAWVLRKACSAVVPGARISRRS